MDWIDILFKILMGLIGLTALITQAFVWSKRYRLAKEAEITALKEQISLYRNLLPSEMMKEYEAVKNLYNETRARLQQELSEKTETIEEHEKRIKQLEESDVESKAEIVSLETALEAIKTEKETLKNRLEQLPPRSLLDQAMINSASMAIEAAKAAFGSDFEKRIAEERERMKREWDLVDKSEAMRALKALYPK